MKWTDFQQQRRKEIEKIPQPYGWVVTDIECPECNARLYILDGITFTSMPPQHKYSCKECGWCGFSY